MFEDGSWPYDELELRTVSVEMHYARAEVFSVKPNIMRGKVKRMVFVVVGPRYESYPG